MAALPLPAADIAPNDTGLPCPAQSDRAKQVELWCKFGSWKICENCHSVRPVPMRPVDVRRLAAPSEKKCSACRGDDFVPSPEKIPQPLQSLNDEIITALRPLDIDAGKFEMAQYGYRVHTSMMTFAWAAEPPEAPFAAAGQRGRPRAPPAEGQC